MKLPSPAPASEPPPPGAHRAPGPLLRAAVGGLVAALLIAAELFLVPGSTLRSLELETLDWRFALRGPLPPGDEVALVMIDDSAVARLGAWPPPRDKIAAAIRRLDEAGVAVIGFNLLLTERQAPLTAELRGRLSATRESLPPEAAAARGEIDRLLAQPDPDLALAVAISAAGQVVTPYAFVAELGQANLAGLPPWIRGTAYRVRRARRSTPPAAPTAAAGVLVPAAPLASVGASAGHVNLGLEPDGSVRAHLPAVAHDGDLYPSLPVEVVRLFLGLPREALVVDEGQGIELGTRHLPTDSGLRHLLNFYGPGSTVATYSLADLLSGNLPRERLAGRAVILGVSAAGAGDRFTTPFDGALPGSELLATAVDNMLTGRALVRNRTTRLLDLAAIIGLAFAGACLAGRRSPILSVVTLVVLVAAWAGLVHLAFVGARLWLAAMTPPAAVLLAGGAVETIRFAVERGQRQRLERQRANLGRYFPPPVVERLAASDAPARLDRTQDGTVMFVDIVGFTRISEGLSPAAAMALLRAFHTEVEGAVFAHGGMVDKFMGDGAMACFGVPEPSGRAPADAILAALDLLERLRRPAPGSLLAAHPLRVGIGIHRGPLLMGDIGGARQFQFTVIGDTVNVASRLEALTRTQDTDLIASDEVVEAARPWLPPALLDGWMALPRLKLRGRDEEVTAWRLVPGDDGRSASEAPPATLLHPHGPDVA